MYNETTGFHSSSCLNAILFPQTDIRSKMFSVSGRYLGECTKFAQMYNCTEMGSESKRKFLINELEEYRVQKQHLEYGN